MENKEALLFDALRKNDKETIIKLIEEGVNLHAKDKGGFTTLMKVDSNKKNSIEIMKLLLDNKVDINIKVNEKHGLLKGETALTLALLYSNFHVNGVEIVKFLIENGADVNVKNSNGEWALTLAMSLKNASFNISDGDDEDPFYRFEAVKELLELMLEKGADINAQSTEKADITPKYHLVGDEYMEDEGDAHRIAKSGQTALIKACSERDKNLVEFLLNKGADVNIQNDFGETALIQASEKCDNEIIYLLLKNGADVNIRAKGFGLSIGQGDSALSSVLSSYFSKENKKIVELLLAYGADINIKNRRGETPLIIALEKGFKNIIKLLIEKGADINIEDDNNENALIWAYKKIDLELIELFLKNGANLESKDKDGNSILMLSLALDKNILAQMIDNEELTIWQKEKTLEHIQKIVTIKYEEIVNMLLTQGVDIYVENKYGARAMDIAQEFKNYKLMKKILNKGYREKFNTENSHIHHFYLIKDEWEEYIGTRDLKDRLGDRKQPKYLNILDSIKKNEIEDVEYLIETGANINIIDNKGSSALHYAVELQNIDLIRLLLKNNINIDSVNKNNEIAFDISLKGNMDIISLLLNFMMNRTKHNPKKLVETLTKFTIAKSNLKHTTHHWDMGQRDKKWREFNDFLEDVKEDWKAIDDDLKNISPNLHSTIEAFLFNHKLGERNPKTNQSCVYSWGEHHLKIGWSSPELIEWCNENPTESPFNYMMDNSKREVIDGVAIDRFSDVINIFKNEIEIRSDKNQLKKIFRNLKKTLKRDFILSIDVSLEGVEFYTDVESFKESLVFIFKMMQERESCPKIKVRAEKFINKGYIELTITQISSRTRKEPLEIINKIKKDDGGDMGKIFRKLSSLCDWRIEYPFDDKKSYRINLLDNETNKITFKEINPIEGFTHILRFYK